MSDPPSFSSLLADNNIIISSDLHTHEVYSLLLILGLVDTIPHRNRKHGILGWDIDYEPAKWVERITGSDWDPKLNPILLSNQTWVHHSDYVNASAINRALDLLRRAKKDKHRSWNSIAPRLIELSATDIVDPFAEFIEHSEWNVAMIGWSEHMRFVYKEADHLSFYDPWMHHLEHEPFFTQMQRELDQSYGYSSAFINRHEDQSDENSCVIDSLARCLLIAEYGEEAAFWPWDQRTFDYALLAARVIRMSI